MEFYYLTLLQYFSRLQTVFFIYDRKIFIDGKQDKQDNSKNSYQGISGKTQIGTWWNGNNGIVKTNLEIDTLYIINKAIDYTFEEQMCFAKVMNSQMP